MPFYDDWLVGCLKNELNISLIARDEETGALLGMIIMESDGAPPPEVDSEEEENDDPEVRRTEVRRTPRHKQRPDKLVAIMIFMEKIICRLDAKFYTG